MSKDPEEPDVKLANKKGFLKGKGYKPDTISEEKIKETFEKPTITTAPTKVPRPETPSLEDEAKKPKKLKAPQAPMKKDPRLKKSYIFRNCLVCFGILVLLLGVIISYQNFLTLSNEQSSLEKSGYNLMIGLRDYDDLKLTPDHGTAVWDVNSFLSVTSNDISADLQPEVEFVIEVHDLVHIP